MIACEGETEEKFSRLQKPYLYFVTAMIFLLGNWKDTL